MFLLLAAGQAAHLYYAPDGEFPGLVRLAEIMAFPLLILLALRFPLPASSVEVREHDAAALESGPSTLEREADARLYQSFLALLNAPSAADLPPALTRLVAQVMGADLCLLLSSPGEDGQIPVLGAHDLDSDVALPAVPALDARKIPVLASTLRLGRPVRLSANSTSPDLAALAQALGLNQAGSLLAVPMFYAEETPAYALLLLSPHSRRTWNPDDQAALTEISRALAQVLHRYDLLAEQQSRLVDNEAALQSAHQERETAEQELKRLLSQLETLRQEAEQDRTHAAGLAALLKAQESLLNRPTPAQEASATAEIKRLQGELTLALEEIARLNSAAGPETASHPAAKRIASIAREFNRPADSVIEYASLLLNGASGDLDNRQRKYLERIKISGERLRSLVNDLLGAVSLSSGSAAGRAELPAVLARTKGRLSPQIDAKQLDLRHDYPINLPSVSADASALERLLLLLLGDAVNAAPPQGEIELSAQLQRKSGEPDYILLQIRDQGPIIPEADIPLLFNQGTAEDNPKPPRSLAAARAQAEAFHCKLWFDSDPSYGNRASLLIPVEPAEGNQPDLPAQTFSTSPTHTPPAGPSPSESEWQREEDLKPQNGSSGPTTLRPENTQPSAQEGQ
jgi:signal transduction histidine kinase